jgi:hypothetical protein
MAMIVYTPGLGVARPPDHLSSLGSRRHFFCFRSLPVPERGVRRLLPRGARAGRWLPTRSPKAASSTVAAAFRAWEHGHPVHLPLPGREVATYRRCGCEELATFSGWSAPVALSWR